VTSGRVPRLVGAKLQRPATALALLALAMATAATWLLLAGRGLAFHGDEIFYYANLITRDGVTAPVYGVEYLFAPHNGHLVLLGRVVYEALFALGGGDYGVFRVAGVLGVLACAGLFFAFAVRRTSPLIALALAILLCFFGYANETLMWPFDLHTTYSAALGLGALLALEREDRTGDILGAVLLVLSVLTLEVGLAFVLGAAVLVLQRPDRRSRLWIFLLPLALYAAWWLWARQFHQPSEVVFANIRLVPYELSNALGAIMGCLTGLNPSGDGSPANVVGVTAGGMVLAGFAVAGLLYRVRLGNVPPTLWAFLATAIGYWLTMTAAARAPDSTRYVFVGALLVLLVAVDAIRNVRFGAAATAGIFVVVALAIPANVQKLYDGRSYELDVSRASGSEYAMLELGRPHVNLDYNPSADPNVQEAGGTLSTAINARDYFAAADRNGSMATPLDQLREESPDLRQIADATLVGALELAAAPASAPADPAGCPTVLDASKADVAYFELPRGGALLGSRGAAIDLGASRFNRAQESVPVGQIPARGWVELRIPPDAAPDPWWAVVDAPVYVCPLP